MDTSESMPTVDSLRTLGYNSVCSIGTSNHILHFCVTSLGRSCLIIEDATPEEVDTESITGDETETDSRLCLVSGDVIVLTYPDADYLSYYSFTAAIPEDEYFTVSLESVYADHLLVHATIDDYFLEKSKKLLASKMEVVQTFNTLLLNIEKSQDEARDLSESLDGQFKTMHELRESSMKSLEEGDGPRAIEVGHQLAQMLKEADATATTYQTLIGKLYIK